MLHCSYKVVVVNNMGIFQPMDYHDIDDETWEKDFMKNHRSRSQIQRLIRPEKIGRFTAFVASPDSSSFSEEALRVDGGLVPTIF